jgi:hypothetical protein
VVRQATTIAKSIQKTRPTKRIDAQEFKRIEPKIPTMTREEASLIFAGAGEYYLVVFTFFIFFALIIESLK